LAVELHNGTLHRNFQGYTTHAEADLLAFGVSSISAVGGVYTQNHRELPLYEAAIDATRIPVIRGYSLTEDDRVRAAVIEKILCHASLKKSEIEKTFGIDFDTYFGLELGSLVEFQRDGLVESASGPIIRVTPVGRLFIRCIGQVFDAFKPAAVASRAV
jgi:oxygen-independent coproporphyrinogen-3 oxidase